MAEPDRARIYIDTSIFMNAFEGQPSEAEPLQRLFARLSRHLGQAVTSEFTLAELFGKESDRGWVWQKRFYLNLIVFNRIFDLRPVSRALLVETGAFRKASRDHGRRVLLGDALHAVTAIESRCRYVFTSDKRFVVPSSLIAVAPDPAGIETISQALDA